MAIYWSVKSISYSTFNARQSVEIQLKNFSVVFLIDFRIYIDFSIAKCDLKNDKYYFLKLILD